MLKNIEFEHEQTLISQMFKVLQICVQEFSEI